MNKIKVRFLEKPFSGKKSQKVRVINTTKQSDQIQKTSAFSTEVSTSEKELKIKPKTSEKLFEILFQEQQSVQVFWTQAGALGGEDVSCCGENPFGGNTCCSICHNCLLLHLLVLSHFLKYQLTREDSCHIRLHEVRAVRRRAHKFLETVLRF